MVGTSPMPPVLFMSQPEAWSISSVKSSWSASCSSISWKMWWPMSSVLPMALKKGSRPIQLESRMKRKKVAMTGKKRRVFFSPAMSSIWPKRKSTADSRKFCAPWGTSFMARVPRKVTTARMIMAAQAEMSVLETLRGPSFVMISAGTMISGCGPRATTRPRATQPSTATAPMAT